MADSYSDLKKILAELFQLDAADLDFGIYRIMNQKREEITRFLNRDLLPQVREALQASQSADVTALQADLERAVANARELGVDPETTQKVKELRAQLAQADTTAVEQEVYSHLTNFFRRYYKDGDFLSLRRYKEGVYAIPYEGEEVKLHWANADQYYVKSSESFRDYTFKLANGKRVHFKLAEADTERDNNQAQNGNERRFIICAESPVTTEGDDLYVRLEYRVDPEKRKQVFFNGQASRVIMETPGIEEWKTALASLEPTPSNPQRTLLEKHMIEYTGRNTFDYFIHKDLGGFLRRELDFFIKNEVVHLDDIENETAPRVEQYLAKVKALRRVAHKIIDFLAQIEDFQKRLWLKKKFVVETGYCVTLDRVPEELYPEIITNVEQIADWKRLFCIESIPRTLENPGFSNPITQDFIKANPFLVIDTKYFSPRFTDELLEKIDNLHDSIDGIIVNSENFQALQLLSSLYRDSIRCIYIDPPYNTGGDGFVYKDNYQHSSWISCLRDRLLLGTRLLTQDGILACSLDGTESANLVGMIQAGTFNIAKLGEFVWRTRNTDNRVTSMLSVDHEYVHVFAKPSTSLLGRVIDRSDFKNPDNDPRGPYTTDPLTGKANAQDRPNLHYTIVNPDTGDVYPPHPDFGWITDQAGLNRLIEEKLIYWPKNPKTGNPRKKRFLYETSERAPISSLAIAIKQGEGNRDLSDILGNKALNFPKPVSVMRTIIDCCATQTDTVIDFFAGSGTTAHGLIQLNREDGGSRKYVMVEMGEYFDAILKPRIMKVIYSKNWKDGKPVSREGSSHMFKYIRLESYEDALNNLALTRTEKQQVLLDAHPAMQEQYMLSYMLDVESRGSASLLNVTAFEDPFNYKLNIGTGSVGETNPVTVDLVETFNYLLGLRVKTMDAIRGYRMVTGTNPAGEKVLVIWRNTTEKTNADLDDFFQKQGYNTRDMEFDLIYVNGDNNLENLRRPDETWKVRLTEEEFQRLMFDVKDV